jgi:hypothetical protein
VGRLRTFGAVGVLAAQVVSATAADLSKIVPSSPAPVIPYFDPLGRSLGTALFGGVGAGHLTVGYLAPLKYQGEVATAGDVATKVSALSAVFNAYRDLGTWYGMTPSIGAITFKDVSRARSARRIALESR